MAKAVRRAADRRLLARPSRTPCSRTTRPNRAKKVPPWVRTSLGYDGKPLRIRIRGVTPEGDAAEEMVADDPMAAKIYKSWSSFLGKSIPNSRITEQAFLATRR